MFKYIEMIASFLIILTCFLCIYYFHSFFTYSTENNYVLAAFGATAVLITTSKRKHSTTQLFLGSLIGAFTGIFFSQLNIERPFAIALSIASCISLMQAFNLPYPPGGAISLIPILVQANTPKVGYGFILSPILTGVVILFLFSKIHTYTHYKLKKWQVRKP